MTLPMTYTIEELEVKLCLIEAAGGKDNLAYEAASQLIEVMRRNEELEGPSGQAGAWIEPEHFDWASNLGEGVEIIVRRGTLGGERCVAEVRSDSDGQDSDYWLCFDEHEIEPQDLLMVRVPDERPSITALKSTRPKGTKNALSNPKDQPHD